MGSATRSKVHEVAGYALKNMSRPGAEADEAFSDMASSQSASRTTPDRKDIQPNRSGQL